MLHALVLGSAAGGGFPQWNGNDRNSQRARAGDRKVPGRTQSSLAVSGDGRRWVILNASPDIRRQIDDRRQLQPKAGDPLRSSPIASAILTNADVDHVAGLLSLRERQPLALYAHRRVLGALSGNPVFRVLDPDHVVRRELPLDRKSPIDDRDGAPLGLAVTAFEVPGKAALWLEQTEKPDFGTEGGDTIGIEISAPGAAPMFYIPGCAHMTGALAARLRDAALVFFDGTLWRDDEMIVQGVGRKTGKRMGHMSCAGPDGTIAAFTPLGVKRKIFIHINNTNPLVAEDSAERAEAAAAGWEVACDGMEIVL